MSSDDYLAINDVGGPIQPPPPSDHAPAAAELTADGMLVSSVENASAHDFSIHEISRDGMTATALSEPVPTEIGDYKVEQLVGAGGMGRVYRAEHRRMARIVALKTLSPDRMKDDASVQRFYSEVRAAARLLHPNIVTAFDAGQVGDTHYLAMEFVEGETLSQIVSRRGPLAVEEAVRILQGAATGLARAHAAGIVHRDVKPGNIMVATDGTVKVLDLGLATIRSDPDQLPSRRGRLIGTFQYIAPEQLEDPDAADLRADIYSLGATFFFLMTGHSPYEGEMMDQLRLHREGPLPDLFGFRRDVDLKLDHVFQRMMAKRPQDRYSSLDETLEDLAAWQASGNNLNWLSGIAQPRSSFGEAPTSTDDPSTATATHCALGIDLGMQYIAAAIADPSGLLDGADCGGAGKPLLRAALASREGKLVFGDVAMQDRVDHPQLLAHSLHLYLGQARVDRKILDRLCPPEALLGLLIRQARLAAWRRPGRPTVAAITLPTCYDQLHRRAVYQSAQIAGFDSIRLIDRGLAAGHSQLDQRLAGAPVPASTDIQHWLVVSLTGQACEALVVRHAAGKLQTMSSAGTWQTNALTWHRRMIDLAAERCKQTLGVDPRNRFRDAVRLQQAVEKANSELLLSRTATLRFRAGGAERSLPVDRSMLIAAGDELVTLLLTQVATAISEAGVTTEELTRVLLIGSLTRLSSVRTAIQSLVGDAIDLIPVERRAIAQGAALAAAAEMPGRVDAAGPPRAAAAYDLGLLAITSDDAQPRTLPVIPRGSALPARTGRRLSKTRDDVARTITIVESAGGVERPWRALGTYAIPQTAGDPSLEAAFEIDVNGLLTVRLRNGTTGEATRLPMSPKPNLDHDAIQRWSVWAEEASRS